MDSILRVRSASSRVSNYEATIGAFILRDAAKTPLLRMRNCLESYARTTVFR